MSIAVDPATGTSRRMSVGRAALRLGVTEGQLYTIVIGIVVGLVTAAIGIPPTLRDHPRLRAALQAGPPAAVRTVVTPAPVNVPAPAAVAPVASGNTFVPSTGAQSFDATSSEPGASTPTATYADGGKLGDVEKLAAVGAPGSPSGVAVDTSGGFWVVTDNATGPSALLHYDATGVSTRTITITGQPPSHARGLSGIVLDSAGHAFVTDTTSAKVVQVDLATGAQTEVATLADVPACTTDQTAACEPSPVSATPTATAIAMLPSGDLLVADAGQGIVWKVSPFGGAAIWDKSTDYLSPDAGLSGIAVEPDGNVLLVVGKSVTAGLGGTIYRVAVSDGVASGHAKVATTDPNSTPNGIAVGLSGRIYVALTGANKLLVLDKAGAVVTTLTNPAFAKPFGFAFRGHSLLLTNDDPSSSSVLRVAAEDTAAR